jgi:hypothetical protein
VLGGGGDQRVDVEHATVRRLHDADRDEPGLGADGRHEVLERDGAHRDAAALLHQEREQHRGEVTLGHEHLDTGRDRRGDEADEAGRGGAGRHPRRVDAGEARPCRPGPAHVVVERRRLQQPPLPAAEHRLHLGDGLPWREPERRGVEEPRLDVELGAQLRIHGRER